MKKVIAIVVVTVFLSGCGAMRHTVIKPSERPLATFNVVEVRPFQNQIEEQDKLDEKKKQELSTWIKILPIKIQAILRSRNISLSDQGVGRMVIDGAITKYDPGNRALRYFVGFGAGASQIVAKVEFEDEKGNLISSAEFIGGVDMGLLGGSNQDGIDRLANEIANYVTNDKP